MSDKQGWYHSAILLYLKKLYKECIPIVNSQDQFLDHYAIRTKETNKSMRKVIKEELNKYVKLPFIFLIWSQSRHFLIKKCLNLNSCLFTH